MAWRVANSLETLRGQINDMFPGRSKASDGTIGNEEHSNRTSDHNPDDGGVVRALDITHDPAHGLSSQALADALVASRDPRIKYIISNRKIISGDGGKQPWIWRPYSGANAHSKHVHISVVAGKSGDTKTKWNFSMAPAASVPTVKPRNPVLRLGSEGPDVERMQKLLIASGAKINADKRFGLRTEAAVRAFQKKHNLDPDGVVGRDTWAALSA